MGGISDDQVEWAVVHRLKSMLDDPPKTEFNVTQTFAHFTAILIWTTHRIRDPEHQAARQAFGNLQGQQICDAPWALSRNPPALDGAEIVGDALIVNVEFNGMSVDQFTIWLRNALAHGDGRSIKPIHKRSRRTGKEYLAGFMITERQGQRRRLHLYHDDMIRIGRALADNFCQELSRDDDHFERDAAQIVEAAE